jgi:hypothetical protein
MTKILCATLLLVSAQLVFAGNLNNESINQILTVNLAMDCSEQLGQYCDADPGAFGGPARSEADFTPIGQPWEFGATTGSALSWAYNGDNYFATFGYGGSFDMNGPNGLTFTGVVTSGSTTFIAPGSWNVDVTYFGQWSNGLYADGSAEVQIQEGGVIRSAGLSSQIAPEPGTFLLMGSGLLGLGAWKYRL